MAEFLPVILVGCSHSCRKERDGCAGVRSCTFGGIKRFRHQVVKLHGLLRLKFLTVLVDLEEILGCSAALGAASFGVRLVEGR